MLDELKIRLTDQFATENLFVGLTRHRRNNGNIPYEMPTHMVMNAV